MHNTILLFTRNGMGDAPADLQQRLAVKFLSLLAAASQNPVLYRGRQAGLQRIACARPAAHPGCRSRL